MFIGWSRPIAQQIVSYCTHFNKNITERSIPQKEISWGDVLEERKNVQQFTGRHRIVISFECPGAGVKSFCDDLEDGWEGQGPSNLARC